MYISYIKKILLNQPITFPNPEKLEESAARLAKPHYQRFIAMGTALATQPALDWLMVDKDKREASTLRTLTKAFIGGITGIAVRKYVYNLINAMTKTPLEITEDKKATSNQNTENKQLPAVIEEEKTDKTPEKPKNIMELIKDRLNKGKTFTVEKWKKLKEKFSNIKKQANKRLDSLYKKLPDNVRTKLGKIKENFSVCAHYNSDDTEFSYKKTKGELLTDYMKKHQKATEEEAIEQVDKIIIEKLAHLKNYRSLASTVAGVLFMGIVTNYWIDVQFINYVTRKLFKDRNKKPSLYIMGINGISRNTQLTPKERIKGVFDDFELYIKKRKTRGGETA